MHCIFAFYSFVHLKYSNYSAYLFAQVRPILSRGCCMFSCHPCPFNCCTWSPIVIHSHIQCSYIAHGYTMGCFLSPWYCRWFIPSSWPPIYTQHSIFFKLHIFKLHISRSTYSQITFWSMFTFCPSFHYYSLFGWPPFCSPHGLFWVLSPCVVIFSICSL